jgi:cytochrome c biogenesis protein CcdA
MDLETIIFLTIFPLLATALISLAVAKGDRKKVFLVVGGFAAIFVTTGLSIWIVGKVIPPSMKWLGHILGFAAYSFFLIYFGKRMAALADSSKTKRANQSPQTTATSGRF